MGESKRPDASMELLNSILENTIDPDYAVVAQSNQKPRKRPILVFTVLLIAGLMFGTHTAFNLRTAPDAALERAELIKRIDEETTERKNKINQVRELRGQISELQEKALGKDSKTSTELRELELTTGVTQMQGPGVVVHIIDDPDSTSRVIDQDLRQLVNGFWQSGAEGISINGQRVTSLTAIRQAGSSITINYVSISSPYRVEIIGDPNHLPAAFAQTSAGSWWGYLTTNFDIEYSITAVDEMTLGAVPSLTIRKATPKPK